MPTRLRSCLAVALLGLAVAAAPASAKLKNCPLSAKTQQHLGASYVTSLKVATITCSRGKDVVRAFNKCRKAHGGVKGRCTKSVLGYHCSEIRTAIATQFTSKATCTYGSRRAVFTYTQFT
ncbi:MAG: hypothetical protein QOG68_1460 [Solirubrobacteraceae bacterium]|jgi:hypothetical protein|nr:hypothetical protein [Solirubrobacteraceae bacterium]